MQQNIDRDFLVELRENGTLKQLLDQGLLSWKALFYLDVYDEYDIQIKLGETKMGAVYNTAFKFSIDITTVYRILKRFKNESSDSNSNDSGEGEVSPSGDISDI